MTSYSFPTPCVALDLETTGLRSESDEIIEIGAVLFRGDETLATFHRMVDPGKPLPSFISLLTGITPDELKGAPRFADVSADLAAFIGDHPFIGQNVSFDLAFLAAKGIRPKGPVYDTRDLSRLLRPDAADHSLAALAAALAVTNTSPHRALADAETTMQVFLRLWDRATQLEAETLAGCLTLALRAGESWPLGALVREAARLRGVAPGTAADVVKASLRRLGPAESPRPLLSPRLVRETLEPDAIGGIFGTEGNLARTLAGYEPRPQQVSMAGRVAQALEGGETLLVEAPPGTGKSLAYLVPALLFARANQTPVAIATSTKGLQEQLATKDLPDARRALGLGPEETPVAVLKGRGNYLCFARLAAQLERPDLSADDLPFLARILVWLETTRKGDIGEIILNPEESTRWSALSASVGDADLFACRYQREGTCFLARARREAQGAYLIVTNHALLLADSARDGGVLSHVKHLIIDEAHHLEDEATSQYGRRVTQREIDDLLSILGASTGRPRFLPGALARTAASGASARAEAVAQRGAAVGAGAASALQRSRDLYQRLNGLLARQGNGLPDAEVRLRLTSSLRSGREWQPITESWKETDLALAETARALGSLRDGLEDANGPDARECDELGRRLSEARARLETAVAQPGPEGITWTTRAPDGREGVVLHWAPLSAGSLLRSGLFNGREAVVLASATLTTAGSFGYVRERLGLDEAGELRLDSPFDYKSAAAVFVPSDMPDPDASGYGRAVERVITGLAPHAGGGVLALFTSHAALRQAYAAVKGSLQAQGIAVVAQGIDGPPARLAEMLRRQPRTVLLGAATFWEGVDLASDALRLLIIARLPFAVPNDPITAARSETYPDPFRQYTLPETLLRFRQGLGRLIRSGRDQGAIVILDSRVLTRGYGASFLDALPPTTVATPSLAEMPQDVAAWFQGGREAAGRSAPAR